MNTPTDKPRIILHLESVPCAVPIANRLRSVLKRLLRDYGFRCVHVGGDALDERPAKSHHSASAASGAVETADGPTIPSGDCCGRD